MAAPTKAMALINRLLPVKTLERVLHLNPRQKRRMRQRREEEERIQQRREEEEKSIQQRREEEEKRIQQRRVEEEKKIQQRREEEEKRIQQRKEEEEKRIQQRKEEEEKNIQQRREEEGKRIQQRIKMRAAIQKEEVRLIKALEHETMVSINTLPEEMLERVFHLLPPRDLKAVVLVCRWWREVGEAPALWVWVCLRVESWNIGYMPEVLNSSRLQAVRRVVVKEVSRGAAAGGCQAPRTKGDGSVEKQSLISGFRAAGPGCHPDGGGGDRGNPTDPPAGHRHLHRNRRQLPAEDTEAVQAGTFLH